MSLLLRLVTWWNDQTWNTELYTRRHGVKVGSDTEGNTYYQTRDGKRRWVIYNGECQASRVAPGWHGWLHHTWDEPPLDKPLAHKPWEKPHRPNMTGTPEAYVPKGSLRRPDPVVRRDYEAWSPE
ncbi:NADH:ubiquinone oxidoreductase subunit NDUFA12 [Phaeovulum vinaykumarii]|uniref:NADH:ubiquinone oxidoreductase subunit n=1 Tax=Phaeovulum vinaykumarii TaxID=407234 RepID=A0A1N7LLU6_9RHOB|nr:NADH:ubiquinone oxidoreductase subunit NDUFA12 [Phaeovulum vinaykumarii]SIS74818.1 NADH:ubiquinone oxidoreductase subunit [Phaeovulum vinaykumarii]SOC05285.1 NADH:ubiquinone oxidoreductase subunit [Phaeovulum vinaykumarii]